MAAQAQTAFTMKLGNNLAMMPVEEDQTFQIDPHIYKKGRNSMFHSEALLAS